MAAKMQAADACNSRYESQKDHIEGKKPDRKRSLLNSNDSTVFCARTGELLAKGRQKMVPGCGEEEELEQIKTSLLGTFSRDTSCRTF